MDKFFSSLTKHLTKELNPITENNEIEEVNNETIEIDNVNTEDDGRFNAQKSLINPYELLGLDIKDKNMSMTHVKKSYYQMALFCHPDKGGDSADMRIVQQAYEFIKEQIVHSQNLTDEKLEEAEKSFQDYLKQQKTQEAIIPPFPDIYNDVREWRETFNQKFEEVRNKELEEGVYIGLASTIDGYGSQMEPSMFTHPTQANNKNVVIDYESIRKEYQNSLLQADEKPPNVDKDFFKRGAPIDQEQVYNPFGREIVVVEVDNNKTHNTTLMEYNNVSTLSKTSEFYGSTKKSFSQTDYKSAHQTPDMIDFTSVKEDKGSLDDRLLELKNQREMERTIMAKNFEFNDKIELEVDQNKQLNDFYRQREEQKMEEVKQRKQARSYILNNVPSDINILIQNKSKQLNDVLEDARQDTNMIEDFVIVDKDDIIIGHKN